MAKQRIVLLGSGGHAKVVLGVIRRVADFQPIGYLDNTDRGTFEGLPYLGADSEIRSLLKLYPGLAGALGIGNVTASGRRLEIMSAAKEAGLSFPPIIAPTAVVAPHAQVGEGTVIMDMVVVQPGCSIGQGVILNTRSTVDHDCTISDGAHICPGATLSGGVKIGRTSLVGAGAAVIQNRTIAEGVTLGAGAVLVGDVEAAGIYVGVPAKRLK